MSLTMRKGRVKKEQWLRAAEHLRRLARELRGIDEAKADEFFEAAVNIYGFIGQVRKGGPHVGQKYKHRNRVAAE